VFNETNNVGTITFDYLEKSNPIGYAVSLARKMPKYTTPEDLSEVLRSSFINQEYKPELLS